MQTEALIFLTEGDTLSQFYSAFDFFLYLQFCFALDITYHNVSNLIPDTLHTVI